MERSYHRGKQRSVLPFVTTLLSHVEQTQVTAAAEGHYTVFHRSSMEEVIRDLRDRSANAVVLSVAQFSSGNAAKVVEMVREFPLVPVMALLTDVGYSTPQFLLSLGQLGVRQLVDIRRPSGWYVLRDVLLAERYTNTHLATLHRLNEDLPGISRDCWRFFEYLFSNDPRITSVNQLARHLHVLPSTLLSRFARAGLPSPRRYIAMATELSVSHRLTELSHASTDPTTATRFISLYSH